MSLHDPSATTPIRPVIGRLVADLSPDRMTWDLKAALGRVRSCPVETPPHHALGATLAILTFHRDQDVAGAATGEFVRLGFDEKCRTLGLLELLNKQTLGFHPPAKVVQAVPVTMLRDPEVASKAVDVGIKLIRDVLTETYRAGYALLRNIDPDVRGPRVLSVLRHIVVDEILENRVVDAAEELTEVAPHVVDGVASARSAIEARCGKARKYPSIHKNLLAELEGCLATLEAYANAGAAADLSAQGVPGDVAQTTSSALMIPRHYVYLRPTRDISQIYRDLSDRLQRNDFGEVNQIFGRLFGQLLEFRNRVHEADGIYKVLAPRRSAIEDDKNCAERWLLGANLIVDILTTNLSSFAGTSEKWRLQLDSHCKWLLRDNFQSAFSFRDGELFTATRDALRILAGDRTKVSPVEDEAIRQALVAVKPLGADSVCRTGAALYVCSLGDGDIPSLVKTKQAIGNALSLSAKGVNLAEVSAMYQATKKLDLEAQRLAHALVDGLIERVVWQDRRPVYSFCLEALQSLPVAHWQHAKWSIERISRENVGKEDPVERQLSRHVRQALDKLN